MVKKKSVSKSEYKRLKVTRGDDWWVDWERSKNGIILGCLFCDEPIDWHPGDHAPSCPVRRFIAPEEEKE